MTSSGPTNKFDTSSTSSSRSSTPPSPHSARRRPSSLRVDYIGVDPTEIVGKVLKRARRSQNHPAITLDFSDNTTFQILVDGYDPAHPGVPKQLEMDPLLNDLFLTDRLANLPVLDCTFITLSDIAFERKHSQDMQPVQWTQNHLALALKFVGENPKWHCVWATLQEHDKSGTCLFRSYDDVYLQPLQRSQNKSKSTMKASKRQRTFRKT